ncbi:hypothetical protein Lalb_Chr14g0363411 [Lupinus albus]|uniref:Uncharacterized protein n=1 Tax=Lupinus albus TaxID=3870 RepID=A0A6A4PC30_LUPAL|nr:hypothetical protein Lalb_Chr14g0363411 [Lupinus albus]
MSLCMLIVCQLSFFLNVCIFISLRYVHCIVYDYHFVSPEIYFLRKCLSLPLHFSFSLPLIKNMHLHFCIQSEFFSCLHIFMFLKTPSFDLKFSRSKLSDLYAFL